MQNLSVPQTSTNHNLTRNLHPQMSTFTINVLHLFTCSGELYYMLAHACKFNSKSEGIRHLVLAKKCLNVLYLECMGTKIHDIDIYEKSCSNLSLSIFNINCAKLFSDDFYCDIAFKRFLRLVFFKM